MPLHVTIEKGKSFLRVDPAFVVRWSRIALLAAALFIGFAQISELPPFEGFDETAHYSYIQQVAETTTWPHFNDLLSAEIDEYLQIAPRPSTLKAKYSYHDFFASSATVVENGSLAIHSGRDGRRGWRPGGAVNWQAQHPPLYYFLMAPFYSFSKSWSLAAQLFFLRCSSYLIAWIGLCLACFFTFSRSQSPLVNSALILAPALWPYLFPMWFPEMARIGNDSLVILLAACACLALKKLLETDSGIFRYTALGVIFGLGLLAKATFLPFAVVTAGFLGLQVWQGRATPLLMHKRVYGLVAFLLSIGVISGWWYLSKYIETGSALGSYDEIFLKRSGGLLNGLQHNASLRKVAIDWPFFLTSSFVWAGTWSFVRWQPASILPITTMIWLFAAGYIGAVRNSVVQARDCLPAWSFAALLFALFNHSLVCIAAYGFLGGAGWYVHSFLPILAPLVGYGLARTVVVRETRLVILVLCLYPLVFLPVMMITQGLFFAGCDLRPNDFSPISSSLLINCLGDVSYKLNNLSALSYPLVAISFFCLGWASVAVGVGGSIYALWCLVRVPAKVDMASAHVPEVSRWWRPQQALSRLAGPYIGIVKDTCIAVVGALMSDSLLRLWGVDFGTGKIIEVVIRASIGAAILVLTARLVERGEGVVGPPEWSPAYANG